jgi:hypothetical protein
VLTCEGNAHVGKRLCGGAVTFLPAAMNGCCWRFFLGMQR